MITMEISGEIIVTAKLALTYIGVFVMVNLNRNKD
jgi:hypothetical protein